MLSVILTAIEITIIVPWLFYINDQSGQSQTVITLRTSSGEMNYRYVVAEALVSWSIRVCSTWRHIEGEAKPVPIGEEVVKDPLIST